MVPNSRGSAAVVFLLIASAVVLGSLWLTYGTRDTDVSARLRESRDVGVTDPKGSASLAGIDEAVALSKALNIRSSAPVVPDDVRFSRGAPQVKPVEKPPAVADLTASFVGFTVTLVWRLTGDLPEDGILVERLGADGTVIEDRRLPPGTSTYRDGPVASLDEKRTYRVSPQFRDQTVAGRAEKMVHCRVAFDVTFLGSGKDGTARLGVVAEIDGKRHVEEFDTAPGEVIGGLRPAENAEEGIDWSTGWRFQGLHGSREVTSREISVPVFKANGRLARDPDSGTLIEELQVVQVARVIEEAMVIPPGTPELVRLLRKSED
jgi:hypothetical protein